LTAKSLYQGCTASTLADTYLDALIKRFEWLAENAKMGKSRDDVKKGHYCFPEGAHLVFYTLKNKQVDIIGIPHQRMDIVEYLT